MNTETKTFSKALESYIDAIQATSDKNFKENYPATWDRGDAPKFKYMPGDKWIRITREDSQKSVFCFVEISTGDIYKAASWSARAKGIRGNIFKENLPLTSGSMYRYR
jgi:hypothetical protein